MAGCGGDAFERGFVNDEGESDVGAGGVIRGRELGAGEAGILGEGGVTDVVVDFDRPVAAVPGRGVVRGLHDRRAPR